MKYSLHGLVFETPFPCPELLPSSGDADVIVSYGAIDRCSPEWQEEGVCYKAAPGKYLLSVPGIADYLVENGNEVTIAPAPQTDEDALRLFFYHEVVGALLMQRGALLLKGCVVERNGKAYAFTGPTPSGKTMLAARLARRGFRIVADGFFCLSGNEGLLVQPGSPRLMLWEKSLGELDIAHEGLKPVRSGMQRYYLPLESSWCETAVNLACVYILAFSNQAGVSMGPAAGKEKMFALLTHRYHPGLEAPLGIMKAQHRLAASLANSARVKVVRYNDTLVPFGEFAERMEKELEEASR